MFTEQAQKLLDQAKRDVWARGGRELTVEALASAAAQHAEGRVLLANCLALPVAALRQRFPVPEYHGTLVAGPMPVAKDLNALLVQARQLANHVPDSEHPGLIGLRHLAGALASCGAACELLGGSPLAESEAARRVAAWYAGDTQAPELGELTGRLRGLRSELLRKIFGQDHAVQAFVEGLFNAEIVAQADAGRRRPRAVFAFAGPPGVGKTFLAELGAEALGKPFKRFDMSAYSDHQTYMQLVGFAPSYQGAKPGTLTGFVAENPEAILLFDEIEKAHLNTINLFLSILDAGRLEDKYTAEDVSFRDTVVIFTTNAGTSLYDRPNATGVNASHAAFHRRTVLDALRTETGPGGQPFFPAAICSRLAAGYPILFNHLGVNELERIGRAEIERVAGLIEQQYFKSVTFDEALPLSLVLREGANTDARTVRSQSSIFVQTELFRFSELFGQRRLRRVWAAVENVHFAFDHDGASPATLELFEPPRKFKVLLLAAPDVGRLFQEHLPLVEWVMASSADEGLKALAGDEFDMILLDLWLGRDAASLSVAGTVGQFDYVPLGARLLDEGQSFLRQVHERLPHVPVYLLSLAEPGAQAGKIDEVLFLACVRSGGARGVMTTAFTNVQSEGWEDQRDALAAQLQAVARQMYREKTVRTLGQERKALSFDTVPAVERAQRRVTIRLRNLRLARAVAAEDASELIEDVERPTVRFADVFGAEAAKEALQFIVDWLKNPRRYAALGVRPPKGILLTGSPGTGKTMLARALAGESDVAFVVASGTDFVTIWQGSGPQNVRSLFARARRYAPAIVFLDEIDAIGKKRTGEAGGGARAEETTLNALLTEMDGFGAPTVRPVIVLAATNLAERLDDALLRRFDRQIEILPPDRQARAAFLRHVLLNRAYAQVSESLLDTLAARSAGLTIADLNRIVNEAAVMAARRSAPLDDAILEEAFEKIRMGEATKAPDAATLERIARHEAGHVVIGWLAGRLPVQVTIVGRGSAGGYVEREADEDKIIYTRCELEQMICQAMGGRAAELIYYGETAGLSTGVASDLRTSTQWAERMIAEFGMSTEMGQAYVDARYLRDGPLAARMHTAIEQVVRGQLDHALTLLGNQRPALDRLSAELLSRNRLARADLERLLNGAAGPAQDGD